MSPLIPAIWLIPAVLIGACLGIIFTVVVARCAARADQP